MGQDVYCKGARIWLRDPETVWKCAILIDDFKSDSIKVEYEDGSQDVVAIPKIEDLPPLRNPDILIGENDLTALSYLNEPEVLYNLKVRFIENNQIYTYCGIVLVAINPYFNLPIYGNDMIQAYRGQDVQNMDPHIFAVAEEAFQKMVQFDKNQSIIVSGESGAGKTVSAKYAMRYFANVGGSSEETQVEKKVLASNPIMESIGNAKTIRNDNSSRFGKYIAIDFNAKTSIIGANMRTYLLEKSRVVYQAPNERNYHIFYQLCSQHDNDDFKMLALMPPEEFFYTNQGGNAAIDGVDDSATLEETREALALIGVPEEHQMMCFRILAAVLHLGNIRILEGEGDTCVIKADDPHLCTIAELLSVDPTNLRTWLVYTRIRTVSEVVNKPLNVSAARFARDALAKHIYAQLFLWIVEQVNKSLASTGKIKSFIGVLDIYGFETFEINSFEQFCINYANEKLQQQFTQHVFKLEQEEYVREEIQWSFVDFYDNQPCIDLIESKLGLLDLLDEECKMPKASDENWLRKVYDHHLKKSKHLVKPRFAQTAFTITHFADTVTYQSDCFLEKNRDTVLEEQLKVLRGSEFDFVADLFFDEEDPRIKDNYKIKMNTAPAKFVQSGKKKTVGSQFRESLKALMETLNTTTPHYVRCIKPNDTKASFTFEPKRGVEQLRACGVLETVKISAAGFPSRWTYQEFFHRYRLLSKRHHVDKASVRKTCENILCSLITDPDKYQFGKTKMFFRAGQVAYMEKLRSDRLRSACMAIQKTVRGWLARKRYQRIRRAVLRLQTLSRGYMARIRYRQMLETRATITIQKMARGYLARKHYKVLRARIIRLQAFCRGRVARQQVEERKKFKSSTIIQAHVKGWLAKKRYDKYRRGIVLLQSHFRRRKARKELLVLRVEARSVEHQRQLNHGLENKIIELQQKIGELRKEGTAMANKVHEVAELKTQVEHLKKVADDAKTAAYQISDLEKEVARLKEELVVARQTIETKQNEVNELLSQVKQLKKEGEQARVDLRRSSAEHESAALTSEGDVQRRIEESTAPLRRDYEALQANYQKLLKNYNRLEQRVESYQEADFARQKTGGDGEDQGYGSQRDSERARRKSLEEVEWTTATGAAGEGRRRSQTVIGQADERVDGNVLATLQKKLRSLEEEKKGLKRSLEEAEEKISESEQPGSLSRLKGSKEQILTQELELDNRNLRKEVESLRHMLANTSRTDEQVNAMLHGQYDVLGEELERRREECVQLRSILASRSIDTGLIAKASYGGEVEIVNEDGELEMAYQSQKEANSVMLVQMQDMKERYETEANDRERDLKLLRAENDRLQDFVTQSASLTPEAKMEKMASMEIQRLTGENLDLRDRLDKMDEDNRKLKKAVAQLAQRSQLQADSTAQISGDSLAEVRYKERSWLGMLEFDRADLQSLVAELVLNPRVEQFNDFLPSTLPAFLLFMCIRYTDYRNDESLVKSLMASATKAIKRVVKGFITNMDYLSFWLANLCQVVNCLRQYSGEKQYSDQNTHKQNEQCLMNFDLSDYINVFHDIAFWVYESILQFIRNELSTVVVPAIVDNEGIPSISDSRPSGMRGRGASQPAKKSSPDTVVRLMTGYLRTLNARGVPEDVARLIFRSMSYYISATSLNNLLLRKELCHWSRGMQIRYNLSHVEEFLRESRLSPPSSQTQELLEPIIQASQLLQARKTDSDINDICLMYNKLTTQQIVKILSSYTPQNEYEEKIPQSFIQKVQDHLKKHRSKEEPTIMMNVDYVFPLSIPFVHSPLKLEEILIPECINLTFVKKI